jgi:hypothetical protein
MKALVDREWSQEGQNKNWSKKVAVKQGGGQTGWWSNRVVVKQGGG